MARVGRAISAVLQSRRGGEKFFGSRASIADFIRRSTAAGRERARGRQAAHRAAALRGVHALDAVGAVRVPARMATSTSQDVSVSTRRTLCSGRAGALVERIEPWCGSAKQGVGSTRTQNHSTSPTPCGQIGKPCAHVAARVHPREPEGREGGRQPMRANPSSTRDGIASSRGEALFRCSREGSPGVRSESCTAAGQPIGPIAPEQRKVLTGAGRRRDYDEAVDHESLRELKGREPRRDEGPRSSRRARKAGSRPARTQKTPA